MRKVKDLLSQKKTELIQLKEASGRAIDVVTSTINQLSEVNDDISSKIVEIESMESELSGTKSEFVTTRLHNTKIIEKFKNLIEE